VALIASVFGVVVGCLGAKEVETEDRLRGAALIKGEGVRSNGGSGMDAKMLTRSGKKTKNFAVM